MKQNAHKRLNLRAGSSAVLCQKSYWRSRLEGAFCALSNPKHQFLAMIPINDLLGGSVEFGR